MVNYIRRKKTVARCHRGQLYGGGGNVNDTTVRGFRSSVDISAAAKALAFRFSSREVVLRFMI
jgi:hypothetical protein